MRRGLINKIKYVSATAATFIVLSSCGPAHIPTSYTYPTNPNASYSQVERDKRECLAWAKSQGAGSRGESVSEGAKGAGLGAILGGIVGYAIGRDSKAAAIGAGIGAGLGGTGGAIHGSELSQEDLNRAYRACMESKGYNVR